MYSSKRSTLSSSTAIRSANDLLQLSVGMRFRCDGRNVRLDKIYDNGIVELFDLNSHGNLQVSDPASGSRSAPSLAWMRDAYRQGILYLTSPKSDHAEERQSRFELLDPEACASHDQKAPWRHSLAWRALKDEIVKTDLGAAAWLDANYGMENGDKAYPKPSPSTLRKWIRKLENDGTRTSSLVSLAGRRRGQSQLEPQIDALVHKAGLWHWSRPRAKIVEAEAWLDNEIDKLNAALPDSLGRTEPYIKPSKETLRKRVNALRCHDTVLTKEGKAAAAKLYKGSGEPIRIDRLLQVAMMDATTLEQVIVFDDDWQLPACKVRITAIMDAKSFVVLGWCVYAGPNRAETSAEAIISCMVPKDYSDEMLRNYPGLAYLFGRPAALLPDNEKALIGPSSLPGINEAGITVHMPPVEMPQAKAALERFFRSLKEVLAQLPGTIIDPKRAKDLDYDGVGSAALTLPQLREIVAQVVASHNVSPSKGLGGRSPLQVWTESMGSRVTPPFEDIAGMRQLLGRTYKALLTRDGVEHDSLRYRHAQAVSDLLSRLSYTAARRSQRKDGSATVEVRIRRADGNIDTIDVYDPTTRSYVTLPSTQPEYTHNLSAWEHMIYRKMAKKRGEAFQTEKARLRSKAITIGLIDEMAPKLAFQQRRDMAALYQSSQVTHLAGGMQPRAFPADALVTPQVTGDTFRRDDGMAPEDQPKPATTTKLRHKAPPRPNDYGASRSNPVAHGFDWDGLEADTVDPETGLEPTNGSPFDGNDDPTELAE